MFSSNHYFEFFLISMIPRVISIMFFSVISFIVLSLVFGNFVDDLPCEMAKSVFFFIGEIYISEIFRRDVWDDGLID